MHQDITSADPFGLSRKNAMTPFGPSAHLPTNHPDTYGNPFSYTHTAPIGVHYKYRCPHRRNQRAHSGNGGTNLNTPDWSNASPTKLWPTMYYPEEAALAFPPNSETAQNPSSAPIT